MRNTTLRISGACTFWTASAARRGALADGLAELGLPAVTEETPGATLRRALVDRYAQHDMLVRPCGDDGSAVVREVRVAGRPNEYEVVFQIAADDDGSLRLVRGVDAVDEVRGEYERRRRETPVVLVSRCMVACLRHCRGVALKDTGGIYWVPPGGIEVWTKAARLFEAAAVRKGSLCVYEMRTPLDADTTRAVTAAVVAETVAEVGAINEALAGGQLGPRAAEARRVQLRALAAKLAEYERVLGADLAETRRRIEDADAAAATAALVASAKEVAGV